MNAPRSRAGSRFGPYELRSLLGRGGMGEVYEAYDTSKGRVVALKLLPEELAHDPSYQERFRRESQATARLAEPHIIPIHDWGEIDGVLYIDMRLVRGQNLRALLRREGPMDPARAVAIVDQVADALDAAHSAGLVHRDVKPANVLVTEADFAYLADFGIARSEGDSGMTLVGTAIGSYIYMAPERFDVGPVDGRADVYSLGCVLHECLTGATPFPVQSVSVLIRSHLSEPPPRASLHRPDVPPALDAVIAHAMAKTPADRYPTAGEFAGAARAAIGLSPNYRTPQPTPDTPHPPPPINPPSRTEATTYLALNALSTLRTSNPPTPPPTPDTENDRGPNAEPLSSSEQDYGTPDNEREQETYSAPVGDSSRDAYDAPASDSRQDTYGTPASESRQHAYGEPVGDSGQDAYDAPVGESRQGAHGTPVSESGQDTHGAPSPGSGQGGYGTSVSDSGPESRSVRGGYDAPGGAGTGADVVPGGYEGGRDMSGARMRDEATTFQPFGPEGPTIAAQMRPRGADPTRGFPVEAGQEPAPQGYPLDEGGEPPVAGAPTTVMATGVGTGRPSTADSPTTFMARGQMPSEAEDTEPQGRGFEPPTTGTLRIIPPAKQGDEHDTGSDLPVIHPADPTLVRPGEFQFTPLPQQSPPRPPAPWELPPRTEFLPRSELRQPGAETAYEGDEYGYEEGEGYGYDEHYGGSDYAADEYDDRRANKRSIAVPIVLGVLGVALAAVVAAFGWHVLNKPPGTSVAISTGSPTTRATTASPSPSAATTTSAATGTSAAAPPPGATACQNTGAAQGKYAHAATGTSVTSCGFAEAVRAAYAQAASAGSQPATVTAVSPVTGRSYTMNCTTSGRVVTCSGGENAVVYVY
ncbi:serine/threonine-protein kinase [Nocardia terpenica]|uniref:serine/threonine-protein kinase n=1 Tax=Nocardia terpenica TaxID=455432 RepID=UPI002FE3DB1A